MLGIPEDQIGRRGHFFELGGTSLSALKLAITLERAVSFKDLTADPILADQAALIDERIERGVLAAPASVPGAAARHRRSEMIRVAKSGVDYAFRMRTRPSSTIQILLVSVSLSNNGRTCCKVLST